MAILMAFLFQTESRACFCRTAAVIGPLLVIRPSLLAARQQVLGASRVTAFSERP